MYQNRIAREIRAVARRVVHIEIRAEHIVGADQLFFLIPGKVRQIEHSEVAILNDHAHRVVVLGRRILDSWDKLPALRIRRSCPRHTRDRCRDELTSICDNRHIETGNGNLRARLRYDDMRFVANGTIRVERCGTVGLKFHGPSAMIVEVPNGQLVGKDSSIAGVIAVVV